MKAAATLPGSRGYQVIEAARAAATPMDAAPTAVALTAGAAAAVMAAAPTAAVSTTTLRWRGLWLRFFFWLSFGIKGSYYQIL